MRRWLYSIFISIFFFFKHKTAYVVRISGWSSDVCSSDLIVIGLGYAVVYYFLFRFVIAKWNLKTPGREDGDINDTNNVLVDQPADEPAVAAAGKIGREKRRDRVCQYV